MERRKFLLEQQLLWMPGDEQHVHCFSESLLAHGDVAGEEDEEEGWCLEQMGNRELLDVQENS